mgnify:FL=1|tara:strand:- start:447 stop:1109 length:663 start_codon:yes stop_codon:yes gene_type:complete
MEKNMELSNILGMKSFWSNFIKPVLPKKHYFIGAAIGAIGGKLLGGGLLKGLLGKVGGGLMGKLGGGALKGIMGKIGMGKFGTGTGFLSKIGQGGAGFMGKFGTGQGAIGQAYGSLPGRTALDKFQGIQQQLGQFQSPSAETPMGGAGTSAEDQAMVGTQTSNISPVQLNQISPGGGYMPPSNPYSGGQWGANAPQAGMQGLQNMQGLLGRYFGGGGYRS